ncbi:MAG TPA: discoidin domain-containing protein [Gemmatimonadaceae bacterium]|nr:discoidin domain-containing protein [Gemmatimonadaceae bacterium]
MTGARAACLTALAVACGALRAAAQTTVLDTFDSVSAWSARPSDGVSFHISADSGRHGSAMRLDFDFHGRAGYAIAHRAIDLPLPPDYELSFSVRGDAPRENLEFKLIDSTGDNVWWHNAVDFAFPRQWSTVRYRASDIAFAWGPAGGGVLHRAAALEIAVTARQGGRGTDWIDDLAFRPREAERPYDLTPSVTASSAAPGQEPQKALDGTTMTSWRSTAGGRQWLTVDFGRDRDLGGLTIRWEPYEHAVDYDVDTSSDGAHWTLAHAVRGSDGGRDDIPLPRADSRWLRIVMLRPADSRGYSLREIEVQPDGWADSANAFFRHLAEHTARGTYPRYLYGEQSYWTVLGVSGGRHQGLLDEDGMLESDKGQFSIQPFLFVNGFLESWAYTPPTQSLARGYLPIPTVTWPTGDVSLEVTAFADGAPDSSALFARYRLRNPARRMRHVRLLLAIRHFQVNPPWQFLNVLGGVAPVDSLSLEGDRVRVNGDRWVIPLSRPSEFGAANFDEGGLRSTLPAGRVPTRTSAVDSSGWASGTLAFDLDVPPGGARDVDIELPFPGDTATDAQPAAGMPHVRDTADVNRRLAAVEARWATTLGALDLELPPAAMDVVRTLRTNIANILIERDGVRLQPGTRDYARSWIRDGALMSVALLRTGFPDPVREFAEWYAEYQQANGSVPCCVDERGADPVPEHDSHGELIFLIMSYYRYTHDRAFLKQMWPHIARAAAYIDTLRAQRMTPQYAAPEMRAYYGLLPQSISHEGYSAKPMHSYWDDFFALRGLVDAADAATALGLTNDARRLAAQRDDLRRDIMASIGLAMKAHDIDFIPGSVELGDFDATSTAIAVSPVGELAHLPDTALRRTFERYWDGASRRPDSAGWSAYTPYETRMIGTFVRLGWRGRAQQLLAQFLRDRRPAAWNEWAEVVWRDPRSPNFIGDMPHAWVGAEYIRSIMDCFAYERGADSALIVGAGVPASWVDQAPGLVARRLPTVHGPLDLAMLGDARSVRIQLGGNVTVPPGGVVVESPYDGPVQRATVNGAAVRLTSDHAVVVRRLPATVVLWY